MRVSKNCPSDTLTEKAPKSRLEHGRLELWAMRVVQGGNGFVLFEKYFRTIAAINCFKTIAAINSSKTTATINTSKKCDDKHV